MHTLILRVTVVAASMLEVVFVLPEVLGSDEPIKLHRGEIIVDLPQSIKTDLCKKAVRFGLAVYPDMDEKGFRNRCEQYFLQDRLVVRAMHSFEGAKLGFAGHPGVGVTFPSGDLLSLWTEQVPRGVKLDRRERPLTLDEAMLRARSVLLRLLPSPELGEGCELASSGKSGGFGAYYFNWRERKPKGLRYAGMYVYVLVRPNDGLIQRVRVREPLQAPSIRFEDVAKTAARVTPGFKRKHLYLTQRYQAGKGRLVWRYAVPPKPKGWYKDVSMWDAMTGELLYSEVFNGGKPGKPYRNPDFYTELTEQIKQRNVEELIKRRVAELQKQ